MTDRAALVAAIEVDPENDLPRLVWADWLEEQGDARDRKRAELIRVQCEQARSPSDTLAERADKLLDVLGRVWPTDLMAGCQFASAVPNPNQQYLRPRFRRGCLTGLMFPSNDYQRHAEAFAGREPLLDVQLVAIHLPPGLADSPHLRRVTGVIGRNLAPFFASPHLTGLREVSRCEPADAIALAASPAAITVRRLQVEDFLSDQAWSSAALAAALAGCSRFAGLRTVELYDIGLSAADYRVLIASPHLSPELSLTIDGRGRPRRGSAVFRDLTARFPGPGTEP